MVTKTKPETKQDSGKTIRYIALEDLLPNPYQSASRQEVDPDTAKKFAYSIQEHGLIQMPVVRPGKDGTYEVGDGWLRRAGYLYNFKEFDLQEYASMPCEVRELTDQQMADLVMEANTVRKDLNPIELAQFYKRYLEDFKVTQVEMARHHNCSQGEIANTIRLLELPEDIQGKIISQEISQTMGRTLLPSLELPEKERKKILKEAQEDRATVRHIERSVRRAKWDSTLCLDPNYKSWDGSQVPAFDVSGCAKCEHRLVLPHPWRDDEKQPRCSDKKCWNDKQREAKAEQRKNTLAELEKHGITKLYNAEEISYDQYEGGLGDRDILDKPGECKNCEHRAGMIDRYNEDRVYLICTNPKCWRAKRNKKSHADNLAREEEARKEKEQINKLFKDIDPGDHQVVVTSLHCIIRSSYSGADIMADVFGLVEKQEGKTVRIDAVIKALREKTIDELLAMLPRLSFEILRNRYYYDHSLIKKMLANFQAAPAKELKADGHDALNMSEEEFKAKANARDGKFPCVKCSPDKTGHCAFCGRLCQDKDGNYIPPDPLAALVIHVAHDKVQEHTIKKGDIFIRCRNLKAGVLNLTEQLRWSADEDKALQALKELPASSNRDLLIGILEAGDA